MKNLRYELIIAEGDVSLMHKLERFEQKHPRAKIESSSHGILMKKQELPLEQLTHYYTIWYRED